MAYHPVLLGTSLVLVLKVPHPRKLLSLKQTGRLVTLANRYKEYNKKSQHKISKMKEY